MARNLVGIFALTCISFACFSQDILWVRQSEDVAFLEGAWSGKIEKDNNGNIIALYRLQGRAKFEGDLVQSNGMDDILLIKYNPAGHIIWKRQMGGPDWDIGEDLSVDTQNNIVISATMPQGGSMLGQTVDKANGLAVAAKISSDGDLIWVKQFGGSNIFAQANAITTDGLDNVIVSARVDRYVLSLSKYTSGGVLMWQKTLTQSGCCITPEITDIKASTDNTIYLMGDYLTRITMDGHSIEATRLHGVFIVKLMGDGAYLWGGQMDAPEVGLTDIRSIELDLDADGNAYVAGYFEDKAIFGSDTLTKKNPIDDRTGYITKLNTNGQFQWARALYGRDVIPGSIRINNITGELSVCLGSNEYFQYADQYVSSRVGSQSLVLTTDLNGKFKKSFSINDESYPSYLSDIVFNAANEFYVMGAFIEDFTLGCFTLDGGSQFTSFLMKSGKIPDMAVTDVDGYCVPDTVRVRASGPGIDQATKFKWVFPPGITSLSGAYETVDNFIDVTIATGFEPAPFTVIPYYECYPRTEFSGLFKKQIFVPEKLPLPLGDSIVCVGTDVRYAVTQPLEPVRYEWTSTEGIDQEPSDINIIDISTSLKNQVAYLKVRAFNQCGKGEFSDSIRIKLNPVPQKPVIQGERNFCAGHLPTTLTANAARDVVSFGWQFAHAPKSFSSAVADSSSIKVQFASQQASSTVWATSKGWCENTDSDPWTIQMTPELPPVSVITGDDTVCKNSAGLLYAVNPISQNVIYHWSLPPGFSFTTDSDHSVIVNAGSKALSGTIQLYISNACFTSDPNELDVTVMTMPEVPELKIEKCAHWIEYTGEDNFTWYKDNVALPDESPVLEVLDSGFYKIELTNFCGNTWSDNVELLPIDLKNTSIPNVITPNNDSKNDYFVITPALVQSPTALEVINRWGKTVYQSPQYKNNWNGGDLSPGIYYYSLRNSCLNNPLTGWLQIIK